MYVIFSSFGNDSIALIQWARQKELEDVWVGYSNTGWAAKWWHHRVEDCENVLIKLGVDISQICADDIWGIFNNAAPTHGEKE